jgi:hypothetical protein
MDKKGPYRVWAVIAMLALMALACGLSVDLVSTAVPTQPAFLFPTGLPVPVSSATSPPLPTVPNSSVPSPAPEVTATGAGSQVTADVQDYFGRGYLPYENGELQILDDFSQSRPGLSAFDFTPTHHDVQDFALWADIVLRTTGITTYPNYTGCGFAYRVQNNNEGYTAILANDYVRMGACNSGMSQCTLFGTMYGFGTGQVDVPNGTKTRFSVAVSKTHAWAFVDGTLVGQYALYTTKLLGTGGLYYGAVSNINAGYWTSCQISNVRVWESRP